MADFRSGFVAIAGRANVGKSSLLNAFLDFDLAISTPKPQTTRNLIRGVYEDQRMQIAFLDSPGLHRAKNLLDRYMLKSISLALGMADVVLVMVEAGWKAELRQIEKDLFHRLKLMEKPAILLINKIDTGSKANVLPLIETYSEAYDFASIIPISVKHKDGLEIILEEIYKLLPVREQLFATTDWTDQSERAIVRELIRESLLYELKEELPYGTAVIIDEFSDNGPEGFSIYATIFAEEIRHRQIILGKNGQMIKAIGMRSRQRILNVLERPAELFLEVKASKRWRDSEKSMQELGYDFNDLK